MDLCPASSDRIRAVALRRNQDGGRRNGHIGQPGDARRGVERFAGLVAARRGWRSECPDSTYGKYPGVRTCAISNKSDQMHDGS